MKLLRQSFEKDKSGSIKVIPQDKEDLWSLYNLIQKDDEVKLSTSRNIKKGNDGIKDKGKTDKKIVTLKISIENLEYVPSDSSMRLKGKTVEQNEFVPMGSYHTAEIILNKSITLYKSEWDQVSYDIVAKACSVDEKAEIGAIVLEEGVAHLCLVTENMTVLRNKIEKSIPRKHRGETGGGSHDRALQKFYSLIIDTMKRNFNMEKLKAVIIASPGFTGQSLLNAINDNAVKENDKAIIKNKFKFLVVHSSTGYLQGLEEALKEPSVQKVLSNTKYAKEARIFDEFEKLLNEDNGFAWYGPEEAVKAADLGAVKYLLLTDRLFKSEDISERKHYIRLSEQVKNSGGEVLIFSILHESGQRLDHITGVAMILNYPILDLDEEE